MSNGYINVNGIKYKVDIPLNSKRFSNWRYNLISTAVTELKTQIPINCTLKKALFRRIAFHTSGRVPVKNSTTNKRSKYQMLTRGSRCD